jgi:maleate isomerase
MSMGKGYHRVSEERLHGRTVEAGGPAPVVTSAGALVDGL